MNRIGAQVGISLKYDQSAVSHWVAGTQPREQVRPVIIEALERRLGRPVTYAEAGLRPPKGGRGSDSGDTVESLLDLGRADMDPSRRGVLTAGLYSAALAVPLFAGEAHAEERERAIKPTTHIGAGEVATVRTMTDRIADILDELGGGHARPMAAAFLGNTVAPYLRASASGQVKRDMLSAASDLTYLTGWMAMFEREHGLGQRYYVKALHIAHEANDHMTYCRYETGDLPRSITALKTALRAQPKQERQGRVHFNAVMAQRQFELGHIEEACATWGAFLDGYAGLSSARGDEHFSTMRKRTAPYKKVRAVQELSARAQQVAALKG